jgi:transcriptional antiterminator RfaH
MMVAKAKTHRPEEQVALLQPRGVSPLVWIVVQSKPCQELKAKQHLAEQRFEVYLPMVRFQDKRGVTMAKPFFPRYLFARVTLDVERWQSVYGTLGVHGVIGRPECPIGVKDVVIDRIKAAELEGYVQFQQALKGPVLEVGAAYRDVHTGLEGLFVEQVDEKRVLLLTRLLGQAPLTVDIRRLKKI